MPLEFYISWNVFYTARVHLGIIGLGGGESTQYQANT